MIGALKAGAPREALVYGRGALAGQVPDPGGEARALLAIAAGVARAGLSGLDDKDFSDNVMARYGTLIVRRKAGTPLSHLRGTRDFYKHTFKVTPDVLDPRADTEVLVEAALGGPFERVLDLGTGSGCVLLSLLAERGGVQGVGADISQAALEVACENAKALGVCARARFVHSDWLDGIEGRFDLIVSNPPYISLADYQELMIDVRGFEPRIALTDEGDGLSVYRLLCAQAGGYLTDLGRFIVEIGFDQGAAVQDIFDAAGFTEIQCLSDIEGRSRVVSGVWVGGRAVI